LVAVLARALIVKAVMDSNRGRTAQPKPSAGVPDPCLLAGYSFLGQGLPGFAEFLHLDSCTVNRPQIQAASHFQEESVSRISSTPQLIPQVLRDTLR